MVMFKKSKNLSIKAQQLFKTPSPAIVFYKDCEGHYLGSNEQFASLFKLSPQTLCGATDFDLPILKEDSDFHRKKDLEVQKSQIPLFFYETCTLVLNKQIEVQTFKMPFYNDNGEVAGIYGLSTPLNTITFKDIASYAEEAGVEKKYLSFMQKQTGGYFLSPRELECLYFVVKGLTAKQIAKHMNLSFRTIEFYRDKIKLKLNCDSRQCLIQKALSLDAIKSLL
ncbi:MAG: hypothetical protein A3I12_03360 [Gammaproteobacteria bacterium RIFCSPLOWO2_02_FULL_38_11]|nr:MAG: hypothetical protein A2W47_02815 [Gammaproteobacteria bacterium RIFCSPHIGHO2_12_38_15]OGT66718.1 MAG: hypothetical protein A3I12_03360 [Gammaproteobacteria bacterium RIFCSPLOWO2_02_FULL_38_11]OGT77354.1 MAG: hypothetical protein A3G71_00885 [Gammaproteobacteria bacterium RIFCSPLOWO2_12_FULL_38_14]